MVLDVSEVLEWVGAICTIGAPIAAIVTAIVKSKARRHKTEDIVEKLQNDMQASKEERAILMNGTLACLRGVQQLGANGPVSNGIKKIEQFLSDHGHEGWHYE